jgi:SAM-dependent methyltransferase
VGVGSFLARLPVAAENVVAAEYSPGGRAALAAAGYAVYSGDIREPKFRQMYQGRFGLVFLFQVMEHMDDLEGLFECLRLVTKPGARIFISVPDIRHTRWTETHGGLLDMPPNHTSRWTPASLLALARRMRLEVVDIESRPWRFRDFLAAGTYSAYARRMQYAGSIPNRLHRPPRGILRSALEGAVAACFARSRLRYLPAVRNERRGDALWLELKR